VVAVIYLLVVLIYWKWNDPYWRKPYRHAHTTSIIREVLVVFGFSSFQEVVVLFVGKGIRKLLSRWILLGCDNKPCNYIF